MHEHHFEATHMQVQHEHSAAGNRAFLASVNHGRPAMGATARPNEFHGREMRPSRPEAQYPPGNRGMDRDVPHPSARNMDRPMPRQDNRGNRGREMDPRQADRGNRGGQSYSPPRPENHGRPELRPSDYQPAHGENAGPRGGAPNQGQGRGENRGTGHDRH